MEETFTRLLFPDSSQKHNWLLLGIAELNFLVVGGPHMKKQSLEYLSPTSG